ncbi:MAG: urea ABC transporter ATP-binding subunit UrtE [Acetobacteraceae bacterium]|nr:urea ABC transporter ATP-binding subunit UrtE [Acetobacteraceae bacterium]
MLDVRALDSFYGRSHTLHGVSLAVADRGAVAVLGRNGVGKTTLLKSIIGLVDRTDGTITFSGVDITREPAFRRARLGIAYVPQGRDIIRDFSVRENILLGAFARSDGKRAVPEIVAALFPYLADNLDRAGGLLSGGQQQQLAIARALAADPRLLLLDEPTEGIQPNLVEEIERLVIQLNREIGLTVILVEQNVAFARRAADAFVVMEKGRIVASGPIADLTDDVVHRHMAV